MRYAIETDRLTKFFGSLRAVDGLDLRVEAGTIYGFLGLNGAGKTTTIRMLLGMIHPSRGKVKVLGQPVGPHGRGAWSQVGHLVENPSAYPDLTTRENLDIARRLHGINNPKVVDDVIERMTLASYADRKAGTLSSGNLQRLGLARAMLHHPQLLVLDEPANGLDPAGVVEIRELLRTLAREDGVTIFMSSHILTEVDRLAARIGIIHQGRLIEELGMNECEKLRAPRLKIKARDLEGAVLGLQNAGYKPVIQDEMILLENDHAIDHPDEIARILVDAGTPPVRLAVEQQNLEDHFLQLTGGTQ
jgi:ABC-2 type transport system ATP-binding protein